MLTIIHNLYRKNEFVNESARFNINALQASGVPYQYIFFNDHGDENIIDDVREFLNDDVIYYYSPINYGKMKCSGGWLGALPFVKGQYIHNIGQDDVFTEYFYNSVYAELKHGYKLVVTNGYKVDANLKLVNLMLHPRFILPYDTQPFECFKYWFGVGENGVDDVTRANNNFPAPGVAYNKCLHDSVGLPELDTFFGASDFEYWARILFNDIPCKCIMHPLWYYRVSEYSVLNAVIDGQKNGEYWNNIYIDRIKNKYYDLYRNKK